MPIFEQAHSPIPKVNLLSPVCISMQKVRLIYRFILSIQDILESHHLKRHVLTTTTLKLLK